MAKEIGTVQVSVLYFCADFPSSFIICTPKYLFITPLYRLPILFIFVVFNLGLHRKELRATKDNINADFVLVYP